MHRRHFGSSVADDILPGERQVAEVGVGIAIVPLEIRPARRSPRLLLGNPISLGAERRLAMLIGTVA